MIDQPQSHFIPLQEFQRILNQWAGIMVSDATVGKPFDQLMLGQEYWVEVHQENQRWHTEACFDCEVSFPGPWQLSKQGRIISRSDMLFTFAIGSFKRQPSLDSLHQAVVSTISVGADLELKISFVDEQQLIAKGLFLSKDGNEYPNWLLQVPGILYGPATGGTIKVTRYGNLHFI